MLISLGLNSLPGSCGQSRLSAYISLVLNNFLTLRRIQLNKKKERLKFFKRTNIFSEKINKAVLPKTSYEIIPTTLLPICGLKGRPRTA